MNALRLCVIYKIYENNNYLLREEKRSGTKSKYRSIASRNRFLYWRGVTIVGSRPDPPRMPDSFTHDSSFLSHVKVRTKSIDFPQSSIDMSEMAEDHFLPTIPTTSS